MTLSTEERARLPDSDFAVPGKRELPMHDATHLRLAHDMLDRTAGLTDEERKEARERIKHRAKELAIDTDGWQASGEGLYVRRNLTAASASAFTEWAKAQGFTAVLPEHELHATVVYNRKPMWLRPEGGTVQASSDGRTVERLGDKGAVVLHFTAPELEKRWQEAQQIGASSDHEGYHPHVTITYDAGDIDLSTIKPFDGELEFGPEIHEPLNETWAEDKGFLAESITLHAMSLDVPDTPGHPNKHPFKGILTRIGKPSDSAPMGSGKKRVLITPEAAKKALPTLLGMAVDLKADLSGHDVKKKVGIITDANIKGDALWIEGFLYAADFPDEVARIQSEKDDLGFSWEVKNIYVKDTTADPLVITGCIFTGAAILYKDEAAYITTQLAAQAEENDMTKEILDAITNLTTQVTAMSTTVGEVTGRLDKIEASTAETQAAMQAGKEHMAKVEPHAAALESCAAAMEKDGIGGHPMRGHAKACRAMADNIRAEAAMGRLASEWPGFNGFHASADDSARKAADEAKDKEIKDLKDKVSNMGTKIKDMEAASTRTSTPPERKTLTPQITALLARSGITLPTGDNAKIGVADIDKALASSSLEPVKRMEIKNALSKAGLLEA